MSTPALRTIRENNPAAHIALLVRPQIRQVIEGLSYYDEIIEYDSKILHRPWGKKFLLSRALKKSRFTLSIILPNSFSSAAVSFLAGIPARVGYNTNLRGFMLTYKIPPPQEKGKAVPIPMVARYLNICKALRYTISSERTVLACLSHTREAVNGLYQRRGLDRAKPLVVLVPGGTFGPSKLWPPEYFAQAGDFLAEKYRAQVVIIAGPGEESIALRIESLMHNRPFIFTQEDISLEYLKAIIGDAALVVTNDTGPRHFAVAFGIPVVVMMGSTDPRYTNYDLEKTKLLQERLECSPCQLKVCPTADNRCMVNITPEKVLEACEEFLDQAREGT